MRLRVLIAPDKFKGTLRGAAVAEAIARGWRRERPGDRLDLLPVSDGGDGFGEAMSRLLPARVRTTAALDAAGRPCLARWWWEAKAKTALIESASVIGLAMLPPGEFHPFQLDTFGLGVLLRAVRAGGARKCLLGIGGSATNDGGFGMARALGWEFLEADGRRIERWTRLNALARMVPPPPAAGLGELLVAVDVQNPLLGRKGASRIYGPQKGLRPRDFRVAESCLGRLAQVAKRQLGKDFSKLAGAGAAGGLGFGLAAFAGATLAPGFELFAAAARLPQRLRSAELVITGEGALDRSTFMGKAVGEIARLCHRSRIPCLALAGDIRSRGKSLEQFEEALALTGLTAVEDAKRRPAFWLERLARKAAANTTARQEREIGSEE